MACRKRSRALKEEEADALWWVSTLAALFLVVARETLLGMKDSSIHCRVQDSRWEAGGTVSGFASSSGRLESLLLGHEFSDGRRPAFDS